jgi:hypothetical protein
MAASKKKAAKTPAKRTAEKASNKTKPAKKAARKPAKKKAAASKKTSSKKASAKKVATKKAAAKKAASKDSPKKAAKAAAKKPTKAAAKVAGKVAGKATSKKAAKVAPKQAAKQAAKQAPAKPKKAAKAGGKGASSSPTAKKARAKKPILPTGPRHPKLGYKWICFSCDAKFYDLGKDEPICPKCEANQQDRPPAESKASSDTPKTKVVRPMAQLLDDEEPAPAPGDEMEMDDKPVSPGEKMFDDTEGESGGLDIDVEAETDGTAEPPEIDVL